MEQERRTETWSSIRRRELSCESNEMAAKVVEQLGARLMTGVEERRRQTEEEGEVRAKRGEL